MKIGESGGSPESGKMRMGDPPEYKLQVNQGPEYSIGVNGPRRVLLG